MSANPHIFAVILAGGSGTRFWPASRRLRPKQLLPLGPAAPHSLIKKTKERLSSLVPPGQLFVSTGTHLVSATQAELPDLEGSAFLAEPEAKNTAPCIAWAAQVIFERDPDAVLCVLPSDQHAANEPAFVEAMRQAIKAASNGVITTIGIVPTRPETGYGYIQKGAPDGDALLVQGFFEKPDRATAESYLASGKYLWNAGIFVFRAKDMLQAVEQHLPSVHAALLELKREGCTDAAAVSKYFQSCPSVSIDYGVMEKQDRLYVVPADFGWSDLGSWESAWELSAHDSHGNSGPEGTVWVDAKDNLVEDLRSSGGPKKVIALVGVSDLCVVETDDALLIMPRQRSQDVREVVAELKKRGSDELV